MVLIQKMYPFISYEDRCIAKQQSGLDSVIPNLLFCARVAPNKGILIALEVWKQIYEHYPDSKFYIVGGGDNTLLDEARRVSEQCNNSIMWWVKLMMLHHTIDCLMYIFFHLSMKDYLHLY